MDLSEPRPRRRPSLTPMIDVVFLLLVFFMLASRFGMDMQLPLAAAGSGGAYQGPPRLVQVTAEGVALNGVAVDEDTLADDLAPLMEDKADTVILRAGEGTPLQRLVEVMGALDKAGLTNLVLVE